MPWAATLMVAASATLNRIRGDKSLLGIGKSLWYVAPLYGLAGFLLAGLPWLAGVALGGVYLIWALPPWGRWFGLGRAPVPQRAASWYELLIERLTVTVHGRFLIRHAVLLPFLVLLAYWSVPWALSGLLLPFLFVGTYEAFWRVYDLRFWLAERPAWDHWLRPVALAPTAYAEAAVGGLWGVYAVLGGWFVGG